MPLAASALAVTTIGVSKENLLSQLDCRPQHQGADMPGYYKTRDYCSVLPQQWNHLKMYTHVQKQKALQIGQWYDIPT